MKTPDRGLLNWSIITISVLFQYIYIYIPCTSCLDKMFIKLHKHNKLVFLNKPEAAKVHGICLKSGQSSSLTWTLLKLFDNPSNKTEKEKYILHRSKYLSKINTNYSSVLCGKISEFHMINLWKFWSDLPQLSFAWQMIKMCVFSDSTAWLENVHWQTLKLLAIVLCSHQLLKLTL